MECILPRKYGSIFDDDAEASTSKETYCTKGKKHEESKSRTISDTWEKYASDTIRAIHEDFSAIIEEFVSKGTIRFQPFAQIWKERGYQYFFCGRQSEEENIWFTRLAFQIAASYLKPDSSQAQQCGALYLIYALFNMQVLRPPQKVRLNVKQLQCLREVYDIAEEDSHFDTLSIVSVLLHNSGIRACYLPQRMYLEDSYRDWLDLLKEEELIARPLEKVPDELVEYHNSEHFKKLQKLQEMYLRAKSRGRKLLADRKLLAKERPSTSTRKINATNNPIAVLCTLGEEMSNFIPKEPEEFQIKPRERKSKMNVLKERAYKQLAGGENGGTKGYRRNTRLASTSSEKSEGEGNASTPASAHSSPSGKSAKRRPGRPRRNLDPAHAMYGLNGTASSSDQIEIVEHTTPPKAVVRHSAKGQRGHRKQGLSTGMPYWRQLRQDRYNATRPPPTTVQAAVKKKSVKKKQEKQKSRLKQKGEEKLKLLPKSKPKTTMENILEGCDVRKVIVSVEVDTDEADGCVDFVDASNDELHADGNAGIEMVNNEAAEAKEGSSEKRKRESPQKDVTTPNKSQAIRGGQKVISPKKQKISDTILSRQSNVSAKRVTKTASVGSLIRAAPENDPVIRAMVAQNRSPKASVHSPKSVLPPKTTAATNVSPGKSTMSSNESVEANVSRNTSLEKAIVSAQLLPKQTKAMPQKDSAIKAANLLSNPVAKAIVTKAVAPTKKQTAAGNATPGEDEVSIIAEKSQSEKSAESSAKHTASGIVMDAQMGSGNSVVFVAGKKSAMGTELSRPHFDMWCGHTASHSERNLQLASQQRNLEQAKEKRLQQLQAIRDVLSRIKKEIL